MLSSACIVPTAPLLLPALVRDADPEVAIIRNACVDAVKAVTATGPDRICVVGGQGTAVPVRWLTGSNHPRSGGVRPPGGMSLGAALADWLLREAGWTGPAPELIIASGDDSAPQPAGDPALTLIVLADLSAAVSAVSPRPHHDRAVTMSDRIATAIQTVDLGALSDVSAHDADSNSIEGVPALRYLAATARGGTFNATLWFRGAPFGVDYVVATWQRVAEDR